MHECSAGQKRASNPIIDCCKPPYGCWEMNFRPLEEQPVLLTDVLFLRPSYLFLKGKKVNMI